MAEVCQALLRDDNVYRVEWVELKDALKGKAEGSVVVEAYTHFIGIEYTEKGQPKMRVEYRA